LRCFNRLTLHVTRLTMIERRTPLRNESTVPPRSAQRLFQLGGRPSSSCVLPTTFCVRGTRCFKPCSCTLACIVWVGCTRLSIFAFARYVCEHSPIPRLDEVETHFLHGQRPTSILLVLTCEDARHRKKNHDLVVDTQHRSQSVAWFCELIVYLFLRPGRFPSYAPIRSGMDMLHVRFIPVG
jgi:hypothetical protein